MTDTPQPQSPWTPALVTSIGGAIAVVIAALAAMFVALKDLRDETKATAHKADIIIEKTAEVHALTNKNFSELSAERAVLNAKVEGLEKVVRANAADKKVADDLAAKKE